MAHGAVPEVGVVLAGASLLWVTGAVLYRWTYGRWLRVRFWPFALGLVVRGWPEWRWER